MKTILLLHDEARQPTHLLRNALPARVPIREIEDCRRLQLRPLGSSVSRLCRAHCSTGTGASDFNAHEEMR